MTTDLNEIAVHTATDLDRMWQLIMGAGGPGARSLWVVLLDDEGRPRPVVVPIDDIPLAPDSMAMGLADVLSGLRDLATPSCSCRARAQTGRRSAIENGGVRSPH